MAQEPAVYFVDNDVQQRVLTLEDAMAAIEEAYGDWAHGRSAIRPKTNLHVVNADDDSRYGFSTMEGAVQRTGIVAIRIKSDFHQGSAGGAQDRTVGKHAGEVGKFCGLVYLFSSRTGLPLAIMNDGYLQHVRVGASAGVAAKYLARPDAEVLGVLGSQWMARAHVPAVCHARPIKLVNVYSPNQEHREAFAREMAEKLDVEVRPTETAEEAVREADVLACCTNSRHPVFSGEWLKEGVHISNVLPGELDEVALARIDYTVKNQPSRDLAAYSFGAALPEGSVARGEGIVPATAPQRAHGWDSLHPEGTPLLADVIAGNARGRADAKEITFFSNNEGTGIQFAAVGGVVLSRLKELGDEGVKRVPLDWFLQDIPD